MLMLLTNCETVFDCTTNKSYLSRIGSILFIRLVRTEKRYYPCSLRSSKKLINRVRTYFILENNLPDISRPISGG